MHDETLIDQIAELRAAAATQLFMLTEFLQHMGADPESLTRFIDNMTTDFANRFEDQMRKASGLEPREKPRQPVLPKIEAAAAMASIDWSKKAVN